MNENDNWTYHIKKNFNSFKNDVINGMVKFYGKKYKDIISNRLNDVNFIFYGTTKNGIPSKKQTFNRKKDIIYQVKEIDYTKSVKQTMEEAIKLKFICFDIIYDFDKNELFKYILIPLFANDEDIIHEMIHVITYNPLYIIEEDQSYKGKSGLATSMYGPESLFEETITELEAKQIYELLKKSNNKTFIGDYSEQKNNCSYNHFIHLVTKFHKCFFDEITYSRISLNKNSLINKVGKDLYDNLIDCINWYNEDLYSTSKEKYIPIVDSIVDKMKENYKVKKLI